jgi:hypothetical protein
VRRALLALVVLAAAAPLPSAVAQPVAARARWIDDMAAAARAFLASLPNGGAAARMPFDSDARRDWHYVPRSRRGVAVRDLSAPQRAAADALLRAGLSPRGVERVEATRALEEVLGRMEGSRRFRDPGLYHLAVFGEPGTPPWGWRIEGHHLSVNVTVAAPGRVAMTPLFTGSHPATVPGRSEGPSGPRRGERLHAVEHATALELARSLDARAFAAANLAPRALSDVVAGPGRRESLATPRGLAASEMSDAQRALLLRLVDAYVGLARDEWGASYRDLVRAGLPETRFSWAGPREDGAAFYWRVHGPRVFVEFDHTQPDANHVHSLWRDPANDFGRDDLLEHHRTASPDHGHAHPHAPAGEGAPPAVGR